MPVSRLQCHDSGPKGGGHRRRVRLAEEESDSRPAKRAVRPRGAARGTRGTSRSSDPIGRESAPRGRRRRATDLAPVREEGQDVDGKEEAPKRRRLAAAKASQKPRGAAGRHGTRRHSPAPSDSGTSTGGVHVGQDPRTGEGLTDEPALGTRSRLGTSDSPPLEVPRKRRGSSDTRSEGADEGPHDNHGGTRPSQARTGSAIGKRSRTEKASARAMGAGGSQTQTDEEMRSSPSGISEAGPSGENTELQRPSHRRGAGQAEQAAQVPQGPLSSKKAGSEEQEAMRGPGLRYGRDATSGPSSVLSAGLAVVPQNGSAGGALGTEKQGTGAGRQRPVVSLLDIMLAGAIPETPPSDSVPPEPAHDHAAPPPVPLQQDAVVDESGEGVLVPVVVEGVGVEPLTAGPSREESTSSRQGEKLRLN